MSPIYLASIELQIMKISKVNDYFEIAEIDFINTF